MYRSQLNTSLVRLGNTWFQSFDHFIWTGWGLFTLLAQRDLAVKEGRHQIVPLTISIVPQIIQVFEKSIQMAEINFLCVHKRLRSKRLAPVLIKARARHAIAAWESRSAWETLWVVNRPREHEDASEDATCCHSRLPSLCSAIAGDYSQSEPGEYLASSIHCRSCPSQTHQRVSLLGRPKT